MEERMLTREEIALSILNGIVGSLFTQQGSSGALSILKPSGTSSDAQQEAMTMAFQMADLFIQERNRQV